MSSTLSPTAIHRIIALVLNAPAGKKRRIWKGNQNMNHSSPNVLKSVNSKWKAIYELYANTASAPPRNYLDSTELALVLKGELDEEDVHAIFAHGKPLEFWGCPQRLVSKIVEAFGELQTEPDYLDVTVHALSGLGATRPSEAWSEVYATHLPCYACTRVKTAEERRFTRFSQVITPSAVPANFAVDKFHISSLHFGKRLTVTLHCPFEQRTPGDVPGRSTFIRGITIRLTDETCSAQGRLSSIANRSGATLLLLAEFASDVFGFLERAHVGSSLIANRGLHDRLCQRKQRLPVHHLTCAFDEEMLLFDGVGWFNSAYWLTIRHFQRDLSYTDVRQFKMPSMAGAESDCALIRRYLSNSHVSDLKPPVAHFSFAIKMLADIESRNFSVGRMQLRPGTQRLTDFRSIDAVFGGMRMSELDLSCDEHRLVELVKTTDFFRMSSIQGLRELKLTLTETWSEAEKPRGRARSKSPLWVSGTYLLRNCEYYRVDYRLERHVQSIERKMVRICEEFERGAITETVGHFQLTSAEEMNFSFKRENLLVSGINVEGEPEWDTINFFEWDVYRFRNVSTSEYLTACVGRNRSHGPQAIFHIVKGEVYPYASFANY